MYFLFTVLILIFGFYLNSKLNYLTEKIKILENKIKNFNISTNDNAVFPDSISPNNNLLNNQNTSSNIAPQSFEQNVHADNNLDSEQKTENTQTSQSGFDLIAWFKDNWLLKLGIVLILIGFGWFISYAFIYNLIGPVGRITLGFSVGTILSALSYYFMPKSSVQGKLFLILGSALIIITSFASRSVYNFLTPEFALGVVFLVSLYISVFSLQFNIKKMAVYGLLIAFLSPILTDSINSITGLLPFYLIVVSLSSIWLSVVKGWGIVNAVSISGFFLYMLGLINVGNIYTILFTVFGLGLAYFFVSVAGAIKNKNEASLSDIYVAVINSILIIYTTYNVIEQTSLQSLTLTIWMLIFAVGGYVAFIYSNKINFFYIYSLIVMTLLVFITNNELGDTKYAIHYVWALEAITMSISSYLITKKINLAYFLSFLMIIPVLRSIESFGSANWNNGVLHQDFFLILFIALVNIGLGIFYYLADKESQDSNVDQNTKLFPSYIVVGSFFLLALIWLCSGSLIENQDLAVMIALIIYTIIGITCYFKGLIQNIILLKYSGAILLVLVVLRLVLVDIWDMSLSKRIITFITIGVLFISTAFLGKKIKDK